MSFNMTCRIYGSTHLDKIVNMISASHAIQVCGGNEQDCFPIPLLVSGPGLQVGTTYLRSFKGQDGVPYMLKIKQANEHFQCRIRNLKNRQIVFEQNQPSERFTFYILSPQQASNIYNSNRR